MAMKKILLTGGSGFVGSHCLNYLLSGENIIYCISRGKKKSLNSNINWVAGDILNTHEISALMKEIAPDYLIHCAWYVEHGKFWHAPLNIDYVLATAELW